MPVGVAGREGRKAVALSANKALVIYSHPTGSHHVPVQIGREARPHGSGGSHCIIPGSSTRPRLVGDNHSGHRCGRAACHRAVAPNLCGAACHLPSAPTDLRGSATTNLDPGSLERPLLGPGALGLVLPARSGMPDEVRRTPHDTAQCRTLHIGGAF